MDFLFPEIFIGVLARSSEKNWWSIQQTVAYYFWEQRGGSGPAGPCASLDAPRGHPPGARSFIAWMEAKMAEEPTFEGIGPLDGIAKFLLPSREPAEFTSLENPLEGSVLDQLTKDLLDPPDRRTTLPSNVRTVLWAASHLKAIGISPDKIGQLREYLRDARRSLERWLRVGEEKDVPILEAVKEWVEISAQNDEGWEAYLSVDRQLSELERVARLFEGAIKDAGYRWNWNTGVIEILPGAKGGRPRQLLRDLVKALLRHYRTDENTLIDENTTEVRERIASDLAPFFSARLLDTSKNSPLYNAVNNSLQGK